MKPVRLLLIEDSEDDAFLLVRELRRGGFELDFIRIETPQALEAALDAKVWDAVISDYSLPMFTGLDALYIIQEKGVDLPFILVSGVIGEERAVEAMKAGVHDYIMKGNYPRLVPALERELKDAEVRRKRREAEEALHQAYAELEDRVIQRTAELEKTYTVLQQAHKELAKQMEERTRELREKEVLIKEIHHRVKNNLQVISSLVSLQANNAADETVREGLHDLTYRVRSMALVHEKLYQSADLARIDFAEYSRSLMNSLLHAQKSSAAVRLTFNLEQVLLPVDIAVPCGLILNELAGNAFKHAFLGRSEGEVMVSLQRGSDGRIFLSLRDDGIGFPQKIDWQESSSLGLRLVQMLARQLHATAEMHCSDGTEFQITFKPPDAGEDEGQVQA